MASSSSIDEVSDDAILHILSFLPTTKRRAATSLVSRRWRHLWTDVPSLHFCLADFSNDHSTYAYAVRECLIRFSRDSRPLRSFSADVPFDYNSRTETYSTPLDSSICFLSTTSLRELSLISIPSVDRKVDYALNRSPQLPPSVLSLAPSLRVLELRDFDLRGIDWAAADTPHRRSFEQLDTLVLDGVEISDEQFRTLLAACPFIQKLEIFEIHVPINLSSSVNPRLKDVWLDVYLEPDAKAVIIDLPDLEDLVLYGDIMRDLRLSKSPKLRDVGLFPFTAYKIPAMASFSEVEILSVSAFVFHVEYKEQQDFAFRNLKELYVYNIPDYSYNIPNYRSFEDESFVSFVSFLNRCPSLDTLHVFLWHLDGLECEDMELEKLGVGSTSPCPVKKITLKNVTGHKRDKALIKYLLGKMTCLRCLAIIFSEQNHSVIYAEHQLLDEVRLFDRASPVANVIVQTILSPLNSSS